MEEVRRFREESKRMKRRINERVKELRNIVIEYCKPSLKFSHKAAYNKLLCVTG